MVRSIYSDQENYLLIVLIAIVETKNRGRSYEKRDHYLTPQLGDARTEDGNWPIYIRILTLLVAIEAK